MKSNDDSSVAKQFGVTRQAVYALRKKFGIPSSKSHAPAKKAKILEMKSLGDPVSKIASAINVSQSYVYKILRTEISNGKSGTESSDQDTPRS